jgi:hypothetical protein
LNFDFGDDVKALREHARRVLHERCTSAVVRTQHDPEKWLPVFGKDHAPTIR